MLHRCNRVHYAKHKNQSTSKKKVILVFKSNKGWFFMVTCCIQVGIKALYMWYILNIDYSTYSIDGIHMGSQWTMCYYMWLYVCYILYSAVIYLAINVLWIEYRLCLACFICSIYSIKIVILLYTALWCYRWLFKVIFLI